MKKRLLAVFLTAILCVSMFGGCKKQPSSQDGTSSGETSSDLTSEDVSSEAPTAPLSENLNKDMETMSVDDVFANMVTGINIGNSLDSQNSRLIRVDAPYKFETAWNNPKITQEWVDACIAAGFNIIRIPVSWEEHLGPAPDYTIVESWMNRVQEVVDYAYNRGVYVILNNHHGTWNNPYYENQEAICDQMKAIWTQIAERFKDYDEHLIFEGQNEPRKQGTNVEWTGGDKEGWDVVNATNKAFVEAVRSTGGSNPYRILMVPGYAASSSSNALSHLELIDDDRLIISVHAYTPYNFALNTNGSGQWNNATADIDNLMKDIKTYFLDKGYRVIIGEYGAVNKDNEEDRAAWATYYLSKARELGVPCLWWDNGSTTGNGEKLGLINRTTNEISYPLIVDAIQNVYDIK